MIWYANRPFVVHRDDSVFSELTIDEWEESGLMAVRRAAQSERTQLRNVAGAFRDMFHELSSMHAEKALHLVIGGTWHQYERDNDGHLRNLKGADVAGHQVRQAAGGRNSSLIVRPHDRDDDIFVLVLGWHRLYELTGWMTGAEAKQRTFLCAPDPSRPKAWMVPNQKLHPIRELPNFPQNATDRFVSKKTHDIVRLACPHRKEEHGE